MTGQPDIEIIGGAEHRTIVIVAYDRLWPEQFEVHRRRIVDALGERAMRIEHIGSTSVPGLAAKPIIDMQLSVADVEAEAAYVPPLNAFGYEMRVREPGHRMLRTPDRTVHIHVCPVGSDWERRHPLFRDWLRANREDRETYESVKRELAKRDWPTVQDYADAKSEVIADIMWRAEQWARPT